MTCSWPWPGERTAAVARPPKAKASVIKRVATEPAPTRGRRRKKPGTRPAPIPIPLTPSVRDRHFRLPYSYVRYAVRDRRCEGARLAGRHRRDRGLPPPPDRGHPDAAGLRPAPASRRAVRRRVRPDRRPDQGRADRLGVGRRARPWGDPGPAQVRDRG